MKNRLLIVISALLFCSIQPVHAALLAFNGTFTPYDNLGNIMFFKPVTNYTGSINFDFVSGTGMANFDPINWGGLDSRLKIHDVVLTQSGTGIHAQGVYDFNTYAGVFSGALEWDWGAGLNEFGPSTLTLLDTDNDGIPGTAMTTGTFKTFTFAVDGMASPVSSVPVPTAMWLFGSGLLGLMGVARRKVFSVS